MSAPVKLLNFHSPRWDEPLLMDLSVPGQRGIAVPRAGEEIDAEVGDIGEIVPEAVRRAALPDLPELAQPQVVRHFTRLSQMCMGNDLANDIGAGTCTMKYSPKINEQICAMPQVGEIHPLQPESTMQGILEILYRTRDFLKSISGMDEVSFQPASGGNAVMAAASIVRAYHESNGEGDKRDQVITTLFSHPVDAACPATLGYELITLMPDADGYPDIEALKAAVSDRTAAIFMTNPEDIGLYNPKVDEFVRIVHEAGGLCFTDQANANGVLGKARAGDAGFDMCHFNLHKTFSAPHGSFGPGCGALAVKEPLARFLPVPVPTFDGERYHLDYDRPDSIGKVRGFYGNVQVVVRAYAWIMSMGAEGLREVAETTVLNNNYLEKLLSEVPGLSVSFGAGRPRLDQIRYSWGKLTEDTGVNQYDVMNRMTDYGIQAYFTSHEHVPPVVVPEAFTPEPTESFTKAEIEYYAAVMKKIAEEAYENPEIVKTAPHRGCVDKADESPMEETEKSILTYKKWKRRQQQP